ncbi:MAG: hypothetical protein ACI8S6_005980 [Myxococcota bacterium]|jgi:hypothetical protein
MGASFPAADGCLGGVLTVRPILLYLLPLLVSALAHAQEEEAVVSEAPEDGFGMGALPAVNYNSDEGFGYGLIGTGYWYRDGLRPYKAALTARYFRTTKKVNAHMLRLDMLDVADLPLRVTARADFYSALAQNFCGYVGDGHCGDDSDAIAEAAADGRGLVGEERDDFLRRYYLMRYTETALNIQTRTRLKDLPHKVEILAGYRGSYYIPGVFGDDTPWDGSLYQSSYYEDGETGFASVLQAGMVFDNRDNEPAPNSGYWSEFSLRGASPFWGSAWSYAGVNLTHRQYVTVIPDWLVSATRLVGDATWGDMPTQDIVRVGGLQDFSAIGGQYGGRGMRSWRLTGQVKALFQEEFRLTFARFTPGTQRINLGLVGFFDAGWSARSFDQLDLSESAIGTGSGLRVTWNENFIVRIDAGFSPIEDWSNKLYINLDHIF